LKAQKIAFFKQKLPDEQKVSRASKIHIQKVMDKVTPPSSLVARLATKAVRRRW
jgi:hypothetical protein